MRRHALGLSALILTLSCVGDPPPDDAGDAQWVMDAIPTLLGRPAKSTLELEALVDIASTQGRGAVADVLMRRPEFDRYWAMVLLDDMKLDRAGVNNINNAGGYMGVRWPCLVDVDLISSWSSPLFGALQTYPDAFFEGMTDDEADDILSYVGPNLARTNTTTSAHNSFSKLVEAAVHNDRLDLAFAAHMPVLASTHGGQDNPNLRARFLDRVLNRNLDCIRCHNGEWSITDATLEVQRDNGAWDRTYPLHQVAGGPELVIEGGLFDYEEAGGTLKNGAAGGGVVESNTDRLFDLSQWGAVDSNGKFVGGHIYLNSKPSIYGLKPYCVTRADGNDAPMAGNVWRQLDLAGGARPGGDAAQFAGLNGSDGQNDGVLDVADHFLGISQNLGSGFGFPMQIAERDRFLLPASAQSAPNCISCHFIDADGDDVYDPGEWLDPGFNQVPDWRIEQVLLYDWPPEMAFSNCASYADPAKCVEGALWQIRNTAYAGVGVPGPAIIGANRFPKYEFNTPQHALGIAVAMQVADHIAEELSGSRITLAHGMARNLEGADLQRDLTYQLVDSRWSLRAVLRHVVLSDGFNRRAPGEAPGTNHYVLAQVAKPFAQLRPDPTNNDDKDNKASLGDSVHRHSVVHLVEKVHHALGWPSSWAPGMDTGGTDFVYPSPGFIHGLGQFKSGDEPGWTEPILPAQLSWEQVMGDCAKPAYSVRSPQSQTAGASDPKDIGDAAWSDWIDVLIADAVAGDWPVDQVLRMTRERLIQDPNFGGSEEYLLEVLANSHQVSLGFMLDDLLDDPNGVMYPNTASAVDPGDLEDVVRQYCGALLTSPQFMMGGLSTADATQAIAAGEQLPPRPAFKIPGPIRPGTDPQEPLSYSDWCDAYGYTLDSDGLCTVVATEIGLGNVSSGLLADAGDYLRKDVAVEIWIAEQRSPLDAGTALGFAIDEIVGQVPDVSQDGAADKLEAGQYTSAMTKLGKAADDLLDAEALGCDCSDAVDALVDGGFVAVEAIIAVEKLEGADEGKLDDASALLEIAKQTYQGELLVIVEPDREQPLDGGFIEERCVGNCGEPTVTETFDLLKEAVRKL